MNTCGEINLKMCLKLYGLVFNIKCSECKYTDLNLDMEPCYTCCKINDIEVICKECERKEILFRNFQEGSKYNGNIGFFVFKDVEKYLADRFSKPCYTRMF